MTNEEIAQQPQIELFHNGRRIIRTFEEAHELFWKAQFAWLLPLDWYRYAIGAYRSTAYVYRAAQPAPRIFGEPGSLPSCSETT